MGLLFVIYLFFCLGWLNTLLRTMYTKSSILLDHHTNINKIANITPKAFQPTTLQENKEIITQSFPCLPVFFVRPGKLWGWIKLILIICYHAQLACCMLKEHVDCRKSDEGSTAIFVIFAYCNYYYFYCAFFCTTV